MNNRKSRQRKAKEVPPPTENAPEAERDDSQALAVPPTEQAPEAERDDSRLLPTAPIEQAPGGERDDSAYVKFGAHDSVMARDPEEIKKRNDKHNQDVLDGVDEEAEAFTFFDDKRQRTPAVNEKELLGIMALPSARRVKQGQHQPLEAYTPPCTRSMRQQHARDVISPGVLGNELGYQKRWPGKYPRPQEAKEWKECAENEEKYKELEKKKWEEEKKKKKEKEEDKKKKEAKKKAKSEASKKKTSSKDKKKKNVKRKKTPSRKAMAKKGYKK